MIDSSHSSLDRTAAPGAGDELSKTTIEGRRIARANAPRRIAV
jgi:hypothetical protein